MKTSSLRTLLPPLLLLVCLSCKKTSPADNSRVITLPAGGDAIVSSSNQFAFDFLRQVVAQDTVSGNILISPWSIYLALGLTSNGAANATQDSMMQALQLNAIPMSALNSVSQSLMTQLPVEDNEVKLSVANSIWYRNTGVQPLSSFLNLSLIHI